MAEVSLDKLVKRFGAAEVIHGLDLTIPGNRLTVLLGPSGCGKSTLLRMIAGLEEISGGTVRIGGEEVNEVDPAERGCAMVFQNYALYPHQTVYKNLAFPLKMAGWSRPRIAERVQETAELLQIDALMDRLPRDLSGGQRQRVAMGRAMIRSPKVFLFDEPLSNLDAELRVKMRLEISRLQEQLDATIVFVTHDQVEAMTLAHKIVVMRDGRIEQAGTPLEVYNQPRTRFVAGFLGSPAMNFFDVGEVSAQGRDTRITLADGTGFVTSVPVPEGTRTIGVRPQEMAAAATADTAAISVAQGAHRTLGVEHLGDRAFRYISTPFGEVAIMHGGMDNPGTEGPLHLAFDPASLQAFDGEGMALRVPRA